jgi:hypothetical protein
MKKEGKKSTVLWMMQAEDSSSWNGAVKGEYSCSQSREGGCRSIIKFCLWYAIAIVIGIILSSLH